MISLLVRLAMAAAQVTTPAHPPAVEKHLAGLVGDWTRAGNEANYRDQADGRLRLVQDRSLMGQPWERAGEVFYIPRK